MLKTESSCASQQEKPYLFDAEQNSKVEPPQEIVANMLARLPVALPYTGNFVATCPESQVLPSNRGGHEIGEQIRRTGESRNPHCGKMGGVLFVVPRCSFIAEYQKADDIVESN